MGCCTSTANKNALKAKSTSQEASITSNQPIIDQNSRKMRQMGKGPDLNGDRISEKEKVDTPLLTEDNQNFIQSSMGGQQIENSKNKKSIRVELYESEIQQQKKQRVNQYFDISPKVPKKNKIYHLTNVFPVSRPYSNLSDWQKILQKNQQMTEEELVTKILQLRNRNWIQEQINLQIEIQYQNTASFESLLTYRKSIQLREHFNWFVWSIAQFYFHQKPSENVFNLPKINTRKWTDGFEYSGVYVRVLPFEDSYFIQNEILALKYVQLELLELNSLAIQIQQQYGSMKETLHKDVMLPLITGISCGGFYLYASPVIYTQELDPTKEFFNQGLNGSKIFQGQGSGIYNERGSIHMQAVANQSNMSFSYLHNNISPEFIHDSLFKFMPILKNINTQNMIPIIDFEDYNKKATEEQKEDIELKYFLVNLFEVLPRLSETKAATQLVRFPSFINEEITFHAFPSNNLIEMRDLKDMINSQSELDINADDEEDQQQDINNVFTKKYFCKHGWDFILIQKQGITNENKRASSFYLSREIPLIKHQQVDQNNQNNILFMDEYMPNQAEELKQPSQQYMSHHKLSIFRRNDSSAEKDSKICGNILLSAYHYKKDFKLQYSMNNHTLSTNIESLFSASIDQVVKIIEQSDNIYNSNSIKELFHRKGLNLRFQWIVLVKLRQSSSRDQIMIDILLRVMRKIVNEEIKMKAFVQQPISSAAETGGPVFEEYFQGSQVDNYKEYLCTFMNAILKKKVQKNKQIFDETLLGLFLSRMSVLGLLYSLKMRKEEFIYLESKDILEDIIDAPQRSPTYFMNAVQSYFKIDFKPEILRLCRQDKHLFLSKGQPVAKNEIKTLNLKIHNYFSLREQAYFLLARQISNANAKESPNKKIASKIKTKTDKDKLKQSFQKPTKDLNGSYIQSSQRARVNQSGIGPHSLGHQDSSMIDNQNTNRLNQNHIIGNKESLSTIRQYHNMDKAIINDSAEFGSPPINQSKLSKLQTTQDQIIDFTKLSKRSNFKPTQTTEIILPSVLYKLKTFISSNPMYYFDDQTKTYIGDTLTVLKSYYEMPSIDVVDEWVMFLESQLKDVYSVNGGEQVLLEAFIYQALLIYFFRNDQEDLFKVLNKIRESLLCQSHCAPETIILSQILTGIYFEEQKDQHPQEAEKNYLIAMICIMNMYGDPRGRGNITIPYSLYISWKLSLISLAEDKKLHDSEFAEELFDSSLKCLSNHKKAYREQQLRQLLQSQSNQNKQNQELPIPQLSKFEIDLEKAELAKSLFDIKKYKAKPYHLTFASGVPKSNTNLIKPKSNINSHRGGQKSNSNYNSRKEKQEASVVYVSSNHNFDRKSHRAITTNLQVPSDTKNGIKSRSDIPGVKRKKNNNEYDVDPSEIDLEIEDENRQQFVEENFKNNEWYIGECPFQHWSLYRQQIAQILQAHNPVIAKNNQAQSQYQKQIYRSMLQRFLPKDLFYQWLLKFNPMMYQSGIQWTSEFIKGAFCQNQQMVSSSGSSAVVSSNHNLSSSHHSLSSSTPTSAKDKRNMHLGSYSQILGKEVGGINKQEMSGVLFSMGTDNFGQLGLDVISLNDQQSHQPSLKVLYPRMIVSLRDEIIKDICCGNSHTMVTNLNGQVYVWGANQTGQLGLGDEAPQFIRKPVLNPYLNNVIKLSAGYEHSLAINKNNELFIWGSGGLCGINTLKQQNIPVKMDFFSKTKVIQAVCGGLHTVAVNKDGETFSWGLTEGGQLGLPQSQIVQLCQGQGEDPQVLTPQRIPKLEGIFITQVACGEAHSIAMTKEGHLYGWGQSNYGQLGLGFSGDSFEPGLGMEKSKVYEPTQITGLNHERISKIVCGATFTLFQTEKGDLYGCGVNDLGQLGLDTFMEEMQIASLEKVKKGKHNQTTDVILPTKVICFQGIAIHQIACGESHSLAVSGDGMNMLWAWGMFKNGQLGLGEVTMKMNPRPVQTLCSSQIQRVACGSMHSLALIGDANQISTFSSQYYSTTDTLKNYWVCDLRGLAQNSNNFNEEGLDDEVPDDAEGRVKNPK